MSDRSQGEGWWLASDGKWYPPESRPDFDSTFAGLPAGSDRQTVKGDAGREMWDMPTCPNGHEVPAGQRFCGDCGSPIEDVAERPAESSNDPMHPGGPPLPSQTPAAPLSSGDAGTEVAERPWYKKNGFIVPIALLLLLVIIGAAIGGGGDDGDSDIAAGENPDDRRNGNEGQTMTTERATTPSSSTTTTTIDALLSPASLSLMSAALGDKGITCDAPEPYKEDPGAMELGTPPTEKMTCHDGPVQVDVSRWFNSGQATGAVAMISIVGCGFGLEALRFVHGGNWIASVDSSDGITDAQITASEAKFAEATNKPVQSLNCPKT